MRLAIKNDGYAFLLKNDETGRVIEAEAIKRGFRKQTERHITILGGKTKFLLDKILNKYSNEIKKNILGQIEDNLRNLKWQFEPREIYRIKKRGYIDNPNILEERESYISMIDMPDMEIFYQKLNLLLKSNLPTQVPHITLFTKGERKNPIWRGIPISSIEEFNSLKPKKVRI